MKSRRNLEPEIEIRNRQRKNFYYNAITTLICSYFKFNFPIKFEHKHCVEFSLYNGVTAVTLENDRLKPWAFTYGNGVLNELGHYDTFYVADYAGNTREVKEGVDCVIFENGFMRLPESSIQRFADMFADVDLSLVATVRHSRLAPIFSTNNSQTAERIKQVYYNIIDGKFDTVVSNNITKQVDLTDILGSDVSKEIQKTDWFDVDNVKTLQYLTEFHSWLESKIYTYYGLNTNASTKHAQMTYDEVNTFELPALIMLNDKMESAKKFVDDVKNVFNIDGSLELNKIFKTAYDNTIKRLENEANAMEQSTTELEESEEDENNNNKD